MSDGNVSPYASKASNDALVAVTPPDLPPVTPSSGESSGVSPELSQLSLAQDIIQTALRETAPPEEGKTQQAGDATDTALAEDTTKKPPDRQKYYCVLCDKETTYRCPRCLSVPYCYSPSDNEHDHGEIQRQTPHPKTCYNAREEGLGVFIYRAGEVLRDICHNYLEKTWSSRIVDIDAWESTDTLVVQLGKPRKDDPPFIKFKLPGSNGELLGDDEKKQILTYRRSFVPIVTMFDVVNKMFRGSGLEVSQGTAIMMNRDSLALTHTPIDTFLKRNDEQQRMIPANRPLHHFIVIKKRYTLPNSKERVHAWVIDPVGYQYGVLEPACTAEDYLDNYCEDKVYTRSWGSSFVVHRNHYGGEREAIMRAMERFIQTGGGQRFELPMLLMMHKDRYQHLRTELVKLVGEELDAYVEGENRKHKEALDKSDTEMEETNVDCEMRDPGLKAQDQKDVAAQIAEMKKHIAEIEAGNRKRREERLERKRLDIEKKSLERKKLERTGKDGQALMADFMKGDSGERERILAHFAERAKDLATADMKKQQAKSTELGALIGDRKKGGSGAKGRILSHIAEMEEDIARLEQQRADKKREAGLTEPVEQDDFLSFLDAQIAELKNA